MYCYIASTRIYNAIKQPTQLSIDECEYIKDGNKEFLILNTNDFFADAKALDKIKKTTGRSSFK